jgi:hypothetical protein
MARKNRSMAVKAHKAAVQRAAFCNEIMLRNASYATPMSDHVALVSCLARQEHITEIGGVKVSREIADRIAAKKSIAATHW